MMRVWAAAIVMMFVGPEAAAQSRTDRAAAALIEEYEALDRVRDPISAGREGDRAALSRLPDPSRAAEERHDAALAVLEARLQRLDPRRLSDAQALNLRLLGATIASQRDAIRLDEARIPFTNDSGFFSLPDYLPRLTVIRKAEDAEAYLSRLAALPGFYDAHIVNLRRGLETGFIQPGVVVDAALPAIRAHAVGDPRDHALFAPLKELPAAIPPEAAADLQARAAALIAEEFGPARERMVTFFEQVYRPAARETLAARALPDGEAFYRAQVRRETTTALSPEEIHALGQAEVARIRARMEAVIRETGFTGDFAAFQQELRTAPRFYVESPEALLMAAAEMSKRADAALPRLFGTLPRLTYGVEAVPEALAENYTTGRYLPGSPQLGVAGRYWVNTSRLEARPLYELPALTLHEAVPGHHLQIALAQERTDLPSFRRRGGVTAYIEGWGLYAERLGEEMNFYRTPYELFGRLSYEMWRACRLVADTGIHWYGWSLQEARRCFEENTALSPHNITTEVLRYASWPGQALAYKVGEIEIVRLRAEAEAALGARFDVRAFHDAVLLDGAMPLDVLGEKIAAWITERQAQR